MLTLAKLFLAPFNHRCSWLLRKQHVFMKKMVAILFLVLLCLQAIPVLHFFSSKKSVFYTYVDEDKPTEAKMKEKAPGKEYLSFSVVLPEAQPVVTEYRTFLISSLTSPYLEAFTPPPDTAC